MELDLGGKVALVTGGSRGIGRAIVERLAAEGCDVMAVSLSESDESRSLSEIVARTGRTIVHHPADLSTVEGVMAAIEAVKARFGRLDILVNNAGNAKRGDFFALTEKDWMDGFALKFFGTVRMTRAAWPLLEKSLGNIINVIGVSAHTPEAIYTIAATSNAGLYAFTKAMAEAGTEVGIRVNAVNPSTIETDRLVNVLKAMQMPEAEARAKLLEIAGAPRFGKPENIADIVAFLASPRAEYIHGALIDVDGGRTRGL